MQGEFFEMLRDHVQEGPFSDPASSVVNPELRAHNPPRLYVLGGAVFPTRHGVSRTLTMIGDEATD